MINDVKEVLYSEETLAQRVKELAQAIQADYADKELFSDWRFKRR